MRDNRVEFGGQIVQVAATFGESILYLLQHFKAILDLRFAEIKIIKIFSYNERERINLPQFTKRHLLHVDVEADQRLLEHVLIENEAEERLSSGR